MYLNKRGTLFVCFPPFPLDIRSKNVHWILSCVNARYRAEWGETAKYDPPSSAAPCEMSGQERFRFCTEPSGSHWKGEPALLLHWWMNGTRVERYEWSSAVDVKWLKEKKNEVSSFFFFSLQTPSQVVRKVPNRFPTRVALVREGLS